MANEKFHVNKREGFVCYRFHTVTVLSSFQILSDVGTSHNFSALLFLFLFQGRAFHIFSRFSGVFPNVGTRFC